MADSSPRWIAMIAWLRRALHATSRSFSPHWVAISGRLRHAFHAASGSAHPRRIAIIGWPGSGKTRFLVSLNRLDGALIGNWKVGQLAESFTRFLSYWRHRAEATHRHDLRWLDIDLFTVRHQQADQSVTFTAWDVSGEVFHACFDPESEKGRDYLSTEDGKRVAARFLAQLGGLSGLVFLFSEHVERVSSRAYEDYTLVLNGLKQLAGGINYPVVLALTCSDLLPQQGEGDQAPRQWEELLAAVEEHRTGKLTREQLLDRANELGRSLLRLPHLQHLELERQLDACGVPWCALPLSSLGDPSAIQQDAKGQKFIDLKRMRPVGVEWPFQWLLERFEQEERARQEQVEPAHKKWEKRLSLWRPAASIGLFIGLAVGIAYLLKPVWWRTPANDGPRGAMTQAPTNRAISQPSAASAAQTTGAADTALSNKLASLSEQKAALEAKVEQLLQINRPVRSNTAVFDPLKVGARWTNSLGMIFVPVTGTGTHVWFCIWETRVQDYRVFEGSEGRKPVQPYFPQTQDHPVVNISWNDAKGFCAWLTKKEQAIGLFVPWCSYRLPTDAEWSAAVGLSLEPGQSPKQRHAAIPNVYPWGQQWPPPHGIGNYGAQFALDGYDYTAPVGSFRENSFGLFDMGGNVWEWCEDLHGGDSRLRVLRGGGWDCSESTQLLSSYRQAALFPAETRGFRCVLDTGGTQP